VKPRRRRSWSNGSLPVIFWRFGRFLAAIENRFITEDDRAGGHGESQVPDVPRAHVRRAQVQLFKVVLSVTVFHPDDGLLRKQLLQEPLLPLLWQGHTGEQDVSAV